MKYEINEGTLALIPEEESSRVLEDKYEYVVESTPYEVMDYSCKYFGSSYHGRKDGAKTMLGINYKVPIIVEDSKNIIMFPTTSPQDEECIWVAVNHIKNYHENETGTTIIFDNEKQIKIPISYRSIDNQILRARSLESVLRQRKTKNE